MQVCTSLQTDDHTSTPPLSFLQAGWRSCRPTNSGKALKANTTNGNCCCSCLLLLITARYLDSLSQVVAFIKLLGDTNCTVSYLAAHHYRLCRLVFSITDDSWWHQLHAVYYYYPATPAYHATNANNWNTQADDNNGIHTVYCYSAVLCGQDYRPLQDFLQTTAQTLYSSISYRHVSICPSVTSRYCIETTGKIAMVFGTEASIHPSNTVLQGSLGYFPLELWPSSRLSKFCHSKSIMLSTKLIIISSSTVEFADDINTSTDESWLFTTSWSTVPI